MNKECMKYIIKYIALKTKFVFIAKNNASIIYYNIYKTNYQTM